MPTRMPKGADRSDSGRYSPENLDQLRLSANLSRKREIEAHEERAGSAATLTTMLADPILLAELEIEDLAASIARDGQRQRGLVRRLSDESGELIAGFRRLLAVSLFNQDPSRFSGPDGKPRSKPLPYLCDVTTATEDEALVLNLVENLHRIEIPVLGKAFIARELHENQQWTLDKIAHELGKKSPAAARDLIDLLTMSKRALKLIESRQINSSQAKALRGIPLHLVDDLVGQIERGEKAGDVIRAAKAAKKVKNPEKAYPLSLAELKASLAANSSEQAAALLDWVRGTPGCSLGDVGLRDLLDPPTIAERVAAAGRKGTAAN